MPFSEKLDARIQAAASQWSPARKKMFGGTCYLVHGNMMCGVYKDFLILRLGPEGAAQDLEKAHVRPFDITGRPMKGWVMVEEKGFAGKKLKAWLDLAHEFALTLPEK